MPAKTFAASENRISRDRIQYAILTIRDQKVMLDRDLAELYGVETKRLNEQVKRNKKRFPPDFMFQLTRAEKDEVVANCDHLRQLKFSRSNPNVFTEHGAVMLASVLNSERAVQASIQVVRAFIAFRTMLITRHALIRKINAMEKKYDARFSMVFDTLKKLIDHPKPERKWIGYFK